MERLTATKARALKPRDNRYDVQDQEVPQLYLRVYPTGRKTWSLRYWSEGKPGRETLGVFLDAGGKTVVVAPGEARTEARAFLTRVGTRGSVARDRALVANMPRLKDWFEKFLEINPRDWTDKTRESMVGRFELYVGPIFGETRLHRIDEPALEAFAARLKDGVDLPVLKVEGKPDRQGKGGARSADKSVELILTLLQWGSKPHRMFPQDWRLPEYSRHYRGTEKEENYIRPHEAADFFRAVEDLRNRPAYRKTDNYFSADAILLALFTGARKQNILRAEWAEFDFRALVWRIPRKKFKSRKKTNRGHTIPLIPQAVDLLNRLRQRQREKGFKTPYLFPRTLDPSRPITELRASWEFVREQAGIQRVDFHGLRHTMGTWQGQANVNQKLIAASLGHADPTSSNFYIHSDLEVVRDNMAGVIDAAFEVVEDGHQDDDLVPVALEADEWAEVLDAVKGRPVAAKIAQALPDIMALTAGEIS